jgi:hypothetical protein
MPINPYRSPRPEETPVSDALAFYTGVFLFIGFLPKLLGYALVLILGVSIFVLDLIVKILGIL